MMLKKTFEAWLIRLIILCSEHSCVRLFWDEYKEQPIIWYWAFIRLTGNVLIRAKRVIKKRFFCYWLLSHSNILKSEKNFLEYFLIATSKPRLKFIYYETCILTRLRYIFFCLFFSSTVELPLTYPNQNRRHPR